MLQQEAMIERVRWICRLDERVVAAMMYSSFAQGEGDGFSDIEFVFFFDDDALADVDQGEWGYAACTANLDGGVLWSAYLSAWDWGKEIMPSLAERHGGVVLPTALFECLDRRLAVVRRRSRSSALPRGMP